MGNRNYIYAYAIDRVLRELEKKEDKQWQKKRRK
jgi:hypothetical protein